MTTYNSYELSIDVSGKMKHKTKVGILGGLHQNETLQSKLDGIVMEAVSNKSTMSF